MVDQAVAPLLATLKTSPDDFNTIVQVANLYYDGRQYPEAVKYYQLAVKSQPTNADLLTDLGTSLWYTGDADGAIAEFQTALKYRPDHPGTLFNLGVVRWQGKLRSERCGASLGRTAAAESELSAETGSPGIHRASQAARQRVGVRSHTPMRQVTYGAQGHCRLWRSVPLDGEESN